MASVFAPQPVVGQNIRVTALDLDPFEFLEEKPKAREPIVIPDDAPELPIWLAQNQLSYIDGLDEQEYVSDNHHEPAENFETANLISSKIKGTKKHKVILDLDFDAALIPSSTPGHSHLYLDIDLTEDQMEKLVGVLHEVGIIAQGNVNQWDRFKALFLRLPWIKKSEGATEDDDSPKE
jgi:hypothetical protein